MPWRDELRSVDTSGSSASSSGTSGGRTWPVRRPGGRRSARRPSVSRGGPHSSAARWSWPTKSSARRPSSWWGTTFGAARSLPPPTSWHASSRARRAAQGGQRPAGRGAVGAGRRRRRDVRGLHARDLHPRVRGADSSARATRGPHGGAARGDLSRSGVGERCPHTFTDSPRSASTGVSPSGTGPVSTAAGYRRRGNSYTSQRWTSWTKTAGRHRHESAQMPPRDPASIPAFPPGRAGPAYGRNLGEFPVEGLEETLAVQRLGLTGALERTLRTTNIIENLMNSAEGYAAGQPVARRADDSTLGAECADGGGTALPAGAGLPRPTLPGRRAGPVAAARRRGC